MHLITVSHWLEDQVKESFLNRYPVLTIYNGVDLSVFKPLNRNELRNTYGFIEKRIILGVAHVWSEGKGLHSFIELSKVIGDGMHIVLIGLTRNQIKHLPPNITGIERTNNAEELAYYYNIADVFVTPSLAETFGFVAAEALACGTPVVAFNTSALPELINEDVGFIVPMNDPNLLRQRIIDVIVQDRSVYTEKCRKRAEELFDLNQQYERYLELYHSLVRN
jgi:glycosyltransferase involved in cell wall biosynthesis